jgi:ribosomal protein L1
MNNDIIKGIKLSIEIAKKQIDQNQIEKFCDHIGVSQVYFKSETINKIVNALENEIKKNKPIESKDIKVDINRLKKLGIINHE